MIDDYKLVTSNLSALNEMLGVMLREHNAVKVVAKPWKASRSLSQNSLLWVWLTEIASQVTVNDQHHDKEVWHEYFKRYWCPEKIMHMPAGDALHIKSTTRLDKGEMHHYLTRIEQWAMDKNVALTIPDNCEYRKLQRSQVE